MGDFRGQSSSLSLNDFAENLSKDCSNGLATFIKLHYGLQNSSSRDMGHIPDIPDIPFHPLRQKKSIFFFAFFLRIESF